MRRGTHYAVEGCAGGNISGGINPAPQTVEKGAFTPWPPLRGGSARRRWGRELYGCPKYFGLWQGSLPPPLRGTSLAEGGFSTRWAPLLGELAELARPEGSRRALRHHPFPGNRPSTAKGRAAALPRPSRPQLIHATP